VSGLAKAFAYGAAATAGGLCTIVFGSSAVGLLARRLIRNEIRRAVETVRERVKGGKDA